MNKLKAKPDLVTSALFNVGVNVGLAEHTRNVTTAARGFPNWSWELFVFEERTRKVTRCWIVVERVSFRFCILSPLASTAFDFGNIRTCALAILALQFAAIARDGHVLDHDIRAAHVFLCCF